HLCERRFDLLWHRQVSKLWKTLQNRSHRHSSRRARRQRPLRKRKCARLCALESAEARRPFLGNRHRPRPSWLAHRVLGHGHEISRRNTRHSHRRHRPRLPASRERNCPERSRHGQAFRALLAPRRASAFRGREDVEITRQLLYAARSFRKRLQACRVALCLGQRAIPQAAQFHVRRIDAGYELRRAASQSRRSLAARKLSSRKTVRHDRTHLQGSRGNRKTHRRTHCRQEETRLPNRRQHPQRTRRSWYNSGRRKGRQRPLETQVTLNFKTRYPYLPGYFPPAALRPNLFGVDLA